jgi:mycothiol-dependent nitroreductase-like protein
MTDIDLWVDPACPWAWITSRWLLEVEKVRDAKATFHVMSLSVLNEGRDELSESYKKLLRKSWGPVRVLIAAERLRGPGMVRELYGAMGRRIHERKTGTGRDMILGALAEVGLNPMLADAAEDASIDPELRASHDAGMKLVGQNVGTPVIQVPAPDGHKIAFFGPVLSNIPRAEAAGRLWDGVLAVAGTDGFFELKRTRDRDPDFS